MATIISIVEVIRQLIVLIIKDKYTKFYIYKNDKVIIFLYHVYDFILIS